MNRSLFWRCFLIPAFAAVIGIGSAGIEKASAEEVKGVEELTRGPIHEAFGQPVVFDPQQGAVIGKQPPEPVDELPPEVRPEGENIIWIPGYWSWDEQRSDFIWISGFWRAAPPDRVWVPGYWAAASDKFQWVSGFWTSPTKPVEYLPAPPATLEIGPVNEPVVADQIWVPGCWVYRDTRFMWRPGYWIAGRANWLWVPAYYNWTPRGNVFIDGYWDYLPQQRGMMFAPVYFDPTFRAQRGFVYTPSIFLNSQFLSVSLFVRPSHRQYYFGDYYASTYLQAGVYPWFAFNNTRLGYDPFYAHSHWTNRADPRWQVNQRDAYWNLRQNENARPPHTYAAMHAAANRQGGEANSRQLAFARNLGDVAAQKEPSIALTRVDQQRRQDIQKISNETRVVIQERAKWESAKTPKVNDPANKSPDRWELPKQVTQFAQTKGKGPNAPSAPESPKEQSEPPKVAPKVAPKVEDLLKQPDPRPKGKDPADSKGKDPADPKGKDPTNPKGKDPADPKGKDPLPKTKDPMPDPKLPMPKPKDPMPDPKPKDPMPEPKPKSKDNTPDPKFIPKPKDPTPEPKPPMPKPKDLTPEPKQIPKPKDPTPEPKPKIVPPAPPPQPKIVPPAPPPQPKIVPPAPPPQPKIVPPAPPPQPKIVPPAPPPQPKVVPPAPPPQPKIVPPAPPPQPKIVPPVPPPQPKIVPPAPPPQPKIVPPAPPPQPKIVPPAPPPQPKIVPPVPAPVPAPKGNPDPKKK